MRRKSKCRNRCEEKEVGANTGVRRRGKCLHRCEEKEVGANTGGITLMWGERGRG